MLFKLLFLNVFFGDGVLCKWWFVFVFLVVFGFVLVVLYV